MHRLVLPLATALGALLTAAPALAADYNLGDDSLRSGFSNEWDNSDKGDPLSFELGVRYWYSWGAQSFAASPYTLNANDHTQTAEAYFRVDDSSTKFYAKALGGMSFAIDGSAINTSGGNVDIKDGRVSYAGGDIGYSWTGDGKTSPSFGPFAGYMYWNDSPNVGRANYATGTSYTYNAAAPAGQRIIVAGDSQEDSLEINALRLGFSGKATISPLIDVSAEVAAVPYAKVSGTLGGFGFPTADDGNFTTLQSSVTDINGWGYGAMAEAMLGVHPTSNITLRGGGRAWYLQGKSDSTFDTVTVSDTDPVKVIGSQRYISTANPWSLFRYGLVGELDINF
jgi:hypothetical protein